MAIIYTYPKLTNPQGNELIVVSDVNNKNSTRLITIQSIADLVPGGGGGGCVDAITGIQTPVGTYNANLCTTTSFTSSGGSVSISNTTDGVNFETNCINNYVLKPVICQGQQCNASTASETWLFSCDSSLSQYAGINTPVILENNGSIVPHSQNNHPNSPTNCFYVELWSPTVSLTSTCQSCCDGTTPELKCLYTKCSGSDPDMPSDLTFDKVNDNCTTGVIYVTETATNNSCCYTFTSEVDAPVDTGYTFVPASDCTQAPCVDTPLIKTWDICPDACDTGTLPSVVYGNDIEGTGLVVLSNGTSEACYTLRIPGTDADPTTGITQVSRHDTLDCDAGVTQNKCKKPLFHFVKCVDANCSGDSAGVLNIYSELNFEASTDDVVLFEFDDRSSCCYVLQSEQICEKVTEGINFATATKVEGLNPCASEACGEDPPPAEKWIYNSCSGGCDPIVSTNALHTPGIDLSMWWNCCYYQIPANPEATVLADSGISTEDIIKSGLNCESLLGFNQIEWTKCGDPSTKIYTGCCDTQDTLRLGFVAKGFSGPAGCYEITGLDKEQDTSPCDNIIATNCEDEDCNTTPEQFKWQQRLCGDTPWTDVSTDYSNDAPNLNTIYTFEGSENCFEIQKVVGIPSGPAGQSILSGPYSGTRDESACQCCNNKDNLQYTQCSSSTLPGCGNLDQTIVLSIPPSPSGPPNTLLVQQNETGDTCCYELDGSTCADITAGYSISNVPQDCNDELCLDEPPVNNYVLKKCTDSTLPGCAEMLGELVTSSFSTAGTVVLVTNTITGRTCCYEYQSGTTTANPTANHTIGAALASGCGDEQCLDDPPVTNSVVRKCGTSTLPGCEDMQEEIVLSGVSANSTVLVKNQDGLYCCYFWTNSTNNAPTVGYAVEQVLTDCDDENCQGSGSGTKYVYEKCPADPSEPSRSCDSMPPSVIIEIPSGGAVLQNVVIESNLGDQCCYSTNQEPTVDPVSNGYFIVSPLTDCSSESLLGAGCIGG